MTSPALYHRLRLIATGAISGSAEAKHATPLRREGDWWIVSLPHHDHTTDLIKIGGSFLLKSEDTTRDILDVLVGVLSASRPFCLTGEFVLEIKSPGRVRWTAESRDGEARGGPEPLDQALIKMSRLGIEEEPSENLLTIIPDLEKELPDWKVGFFRSCCLDLLQQRGDLLLTISLCLTPGRTVMLRTLSFHQTKLGSSGGACAATYRDHILPFVREAATRVDELLNFQFPPDAEAVMTWWGLMQVSISPHGHLPWLFLPQI
jgi:hypothetical protein